MKSDIERLRSPSLLPTTVEAESDGLLECPSTGAQPSDGQLLRQTLHQMHGPCVEQGPISLHRIPCFIRILELESTPPKHEALNF